MDFKDFVTRHEDIKETERYYGKCSKQYEVHQKMDEIKKYLQNDSRSIFLGKQCAQEYICIQISYGIFDSWKIKTHWNLERTEIRKEKKSTYPNQSFEKLVDVVLDLVWKNGYEFIDVDKF